MSASRTDNSARLLPDYLIIGAQKSGTRFLQNALIQHPAVLADQIELHYFDWNLGRGIGWYRSRFPRGGGRHPVSREGGFVAGERSPNYLFDPAVPTRVRAVLPDVKLIITLRNPVTRALSEYHHNRRRGVEDLSFDGVVAYECRQRAAGVKTPAIRPPRAFSRPRFYLARGLYAEQIGRWLELFDRRQIHVVVSEQLFAHPAPTIDEIERFIGLSPLVPEDLSPRGAAVYDPMPRPLRIQLQRFFDEDVTELTHILGQDPGWW